MDDQGEVLVRSEEGGGGGLLIQLASVILIKLLQSVQSNVIIFYMREREREGERAANLTE